ncbi:MAG: hypothetical protein ACLRSW_15935 [Christensenellaceae bacterium]
MKRIYEEPSYPLTSAEKSATIKRYENLALENTAVLVTDERSSSLPVCTFGYLVLSDRPVFLRTPATLPRQRWITGAGSVFHRARRAGRPAADRAVGAG